ncbi:Bax inhibitor-1/YccA family protein [Methylobacillus caricis]|uniref:Bax inhibitor-1/YccA family protein n=1 Tax=Methylobacillus caricis TaxID=1971611 RepID=UPI001CFF60CE|nr:Bax inhibitor-1/YccA family protein [Methylobacillus caricis]MCB5187075.1 Bax inhibitor-1/YccA family protein [Methylobacillus caricis]
MQTNYQVANTQTLPAGAHKVLRNTYMMLGLTMIPTVIGALVGMSMNFAWMASSPILSTVIMLAVMFGLFFAISANRNNAFGVVLLLGLTFFMGVMLGPILQVALNLRNGGQLVGLAAGGTGLIFMTLATIGATTKKDFSFMGNFLLVGLILLIVASIANMFFQVPAASLAISAVAVLLFSGFILFDVNRIVRGGETNYVMATLALYINIYNLFVNLLQLLMALMGERD